MKAVRVTFLILLMSVLIHPQDFLEGRISSVLTDASLPNAKVTLYIWENQVIADSLKTTTDLNGYYNFNYITNLDDNYSIANSLEIKYYNNYISTNNSTKLKSLTLFNELGEKVRSYITNESSIQFDLNGLASGRYLSVLKIENDVFSNILTFNAGQVLGLKKLLDNKLGQIHNSSLSKPKSVIGQIKIIDSSDIHYSYQTNIGEWSGTKTFNLTLPTVIPLQYPFTDPEVPYPINTVIDLWKYMTRIQGYDDYVLFPKVLWPLKIFCDSSNAPVSWLPYIDNAVNILRDSCGFIPDSILQINNEYTEHSYYLGYSAVNIIYMDSTQFINEFGMNLFAKSSITFDNTYACAVGYNIYLNTEKITNSIDAQKLVLRHLQEYITETFMPIFNSNYLGHTNNLGPGSRINFNQDEITLLHICRNMSPNVWMNRFFPPGTLPTKSIPSELDLRESLQKKFADDKTTKVIFK